MKIEDFESTTPAFRPEAFFTSRHEGWGVLEGPTGSLQKRFSLRAEGRFDAGVIRFSETWTFDDGHEDTVNWVLSSRDQGRY